MSENNCENIYKIFLEGFDEYGRRLSEFVLLGNQQETTKNAYACLGHYLPVDFIPKIGAWFWK